MAYPQGLDELIQIGTRSTIAAASYRLLEDLKELQLTDIEQFYSEEEQ